MGCLELQGLSIGYGRKPIIQDLDLTVDDGELFALLGPSGAGKTTILKAIAGLLRPLAGTVRIDGSCVDHLPAERRNAVLIFQKPLLFPFLNVAANIGFGLRMRGVDRRERMQRIGSIMELIGLSGLQDRRVHELSGGQQQRVALARGLVLQPAVLLLDEPLSNLDAELRQQMRELIHTSQRETGITTVLVTHDQAEALMLSDRLALLLDGSLRQSGTPQEVFYRPVAPEVGSFFGCANLLTGSINNHRFICGPLRIPVDCADLDRTVAQIRPEQILLEPSDEGQCLEATVVTVNFAGSETRIELMSELGVLTALSPSSAYLPGQRIRIRLPEEHVHIFPPADPDGHP